MLHRLLSVFVFLLLVLTAKVEALGIMAGSVYDGRVGSVQWRYGDTPVSLPVAHLDSEVELTLVFDLLVPNNEEQSWMPYLRCHVRHSNADGEPDSLIDSEYLDGFNLADIGYGEPSVAGLTTVLYRNYKVTVPPAEMKARLSGNYILEIYEDGKPDDIILKAPFAIEEGSVKISGTVTSRTDTDWNGKLQQLEIEVLRLSLDRRVAFQDLKVDIVQNGQIASRQTLLNPTRVVGDKAIFAHRPELIFKGGNEYRRMETVSRRTCGMHVADILWDSPLYHEILYTDMPRKDSGYAYDQTQSGEFTIREADESDVVPSDVEADYTAVHFSLKDSGIFPPDSIYIEGAVTGRRIDKSSAMDYDEETETWRKSLLLKQGAYDYRYFIKQALSGKTGSSEIEGDFHQTQNVYTIYVYYRLPGERTDRLAGTMAIKAEANR